MELKNRVILGDNLPLLAQLPSESVDMIYLDPPFNTGKIQRREYIRTAQDDAEGDRTGFQGRRYKSEVVGSAAFADSFDDYESFIKPRLVEAHRLLKPTGCLYFHIDYREVHYCKVLLDSIFGRSNFLNHIVWAYDFGAKGSKKWPTKHDDILFYGKSPSYHFDISQSDRIPYMAPGMVTEEKVARGKLPTDVIWQTIVGTNSKERLNYPTQKPIALLRRFVRTSCPPGGTLLDFFAGSGTSGAAAIESGRFFTLIDSDVYAFETMRRRFSDRSDVEFVGPSAQTGVSQSSASI
jgi:site-specific DNA-methyltransferase (adenine-specific)